MKYFYNLDLLYVKAPQLTEHTIIGFNFLICKVIKKIFFLNKKQIIKFFYEVLEIDQNFIDII